MRKARKIMLPGDPLPEGSLKPRSGYYKTEEGYRSSYFGVLQEGEETMDVVPFSGPYIPRRGDKIIGKVIEIEPSMWVLDINSPYTTLLHVNDVPWRASSGDLKRVLNVGEYVYAKVMSVNEIKESWITLKDAGLRKLEGGEIVSVPASKVPRIIGREGSMVKMVRDSTFTKIIVGLSFLLGVVIGPAISVYIGTRYIFLISAVLGLTVIIGISRLKEIRMKLQRSGIGITGKSLILGTTGLIVSMLMMSFFYFLPLYHQDFIPSSNYILMIFYPVLAGGIIAVALSGYADRGHSQMLAIFCLIIMTVSVPLVFILSYNIMGFSDIVLTGAVFFTGYSIYEIAFPVMVSRNSSKENYGANFATFNMFQHGGQLIGSVAAGSIIGSVISTHSTLLVAVTFLVLMLFAFFIFIFFGINKSKKIETT